jgi:hypothetical protein
MQSVNRLKNNFLTPSRINRGKNSAICEMRNQFQKSIYLFCSDFSA